MGYSPWHLKEADTTEGLTLFHPRQKELQKERKVL